MWAGLCVNGGGEESLETLYLIQKKRETQGRGAVSFPERLCLIVKETERDSHSYESRVSAKAVSELEEFRP